MDFLSFDFLFNLIFLIVVIITAIVFHEYAHGWMAKKCGDNTAYLAGRITLNPIKHIDPIGTVLIPLFTFYTTGFVLGWAKPVPVQFGNLNHRRNDGIKVALAGPLANLILAAGWMSIFAVNGYFEPNGVNSLIYDATLMAVSINLAFMAFNLIPIPPLDGGRVLQLLLPYRFSSKLDFLEQYGILIVFGLACLGFLDIFLEPIISVTQAILMFIFVVIPYFFINFMFA